MRACSVDNCNNEFKAKGFCNKHYLRFKKHGDPLITLKDRDISWIDKFEKHVEFIPFLTCHLWGGSLTPNGYGQFEFKGKNCGAHRASYEIYKGEIPPGMSVLHDCQNNGEVRDNKSCVNPDHLFLGTQMDNMIDRDLKGHCPRGERSGHAKLNSSQVLEIRGLDKKIPRLELAEIYGVSLSSISHIINRRNWAHI